MTTTALYQDLQHHDASISLVLRTKSGRVVTAPSKAGIGEIRNESNKPLFIMNQKESLVNLKHAGELQAPLLDFLKERGVDQQEVSSDLGIICTMIYVALIAGVGLFYTSSNNIEFLYPYLLACVAFTLSGLALMSYAYKPGQEKWSIPSMVLLAIGALPTSPSSLLVLPMIKTFGRAKLHRLLNQDSKEAKASHG
ncbi:hypothetical protein [Halomonas sp. 328]|uniref:hypothetical protein n=1 Tax=Halomonas sp. 328 TaxID=2776704 RepID=UPI001E61BC5F|nr:hypothetical protein [Halomonas sp. 328]